MSSKEFTTRDIRKIALDYIFSKDSSYKKLAEKYDCSSSKISSLCKSITLSSCRNQSQI